MPLDENPDEIPNPERSTTQSESHSTSVMTRRSMLGAIGGVPLGVVGLSQRVDAKSQEAVAARPATTSCRRREGGASPRPGPDILYHSPASAPQLENTGKWNAAPIMVSGMDAYVDGEYLYQDFVYDDYGANTTDAVGNTPPDPKSNENDTFSPPTGDIAYPTADDVYHHNAADLLEFRTRRTTDGIAYRITLNTMTEADVAGVAIGIDTDQNAATGTDTWGYGLGSLGTLGLEHIVVTWGTGAELDGETIPSRVDTTRNQIEVEVPLQPDGETWRHYLVVGLFDTEATRFTQIQQQPDESHPGGAHGQHPPPVFNVGFRQASQEPMGSPNLQTETADRELDETTTTGSRSAGFGHWREHAQATSLAARDIANFHADIDFERIASGTTAYNVPETGYLNRLYASAFDLGEGIDADENVLLGRIQPYSIYIPDSYQPDRPTKFHLHLHANRTCYNELGVYMPDLVRQLGEQRDAIVLTPEARGPGRFYHDTGEFSVFEAWADAAAHYELDFDRTTVDGYSTGGYGAIKFASQYPDLFAKAFSTVGFAGALEPLMAAWEAGYNIHTEIQDVAQLSDNLRHIPLLMWNGGNDEIVQPPEPIAYEQQLREEGYRHELDVFAGYEHLTFLYRDQWGPAQAFLDGDEMGTPRVVRRPARVTYRAVPTLDAEEYGLVHDTAYWVSDITVAATADSGLVDVTSAALAQATPQAADYRHPGTDPDPHVKRGTRWITPVQGEPRKNALSIELEDVESVTLWIEEANIDPDTPIDLVVESTIPATIILRSSDGATNVRVPAGTTKRTVHVRE